MKLVIDRKRWTRDIMNFMIDGRELHCALGFLRAQTSIGERAELQCAAEALGYLELEESPGVRLTLAAAIMHVNDAWPNGLAREQKIADLFGKIGVDVEFVG